MNNQSQSSFNPPISSQTFFQSHNNPHSSSISSTFLSTYLTPDPNHISHLQAIFPLRNLSLPTPSKPETSEFKLIQHEEEILSSLAVSLKRDWKKIALKFKAYCSKEIPHNILKRIYSTLPASKMRFVRFTKQEDKSLMSRVQEHGMDWIIISKYFPDRCPISLRNRYYKMKRKTLQAQNEKSNKNLKISKTWTGNLKLLVRDIKLDTQPTCLSLINELLSEPCSNMEIKNFEG